MGASGEGDSSGRSAWGERWGAAAVEDGKQVAGGGLALEQRGQ